MRSGPWKRVELLSPAYVNQQQRTRLFAIIAKSSSSASSSDKPTKAEIKRVPRFTSISNDAQQEPNRPFTLPPGEFRPKQSLGQNYLSDQNYVNKIVDAFGARCIDVNRVVEIGPGTGALTRSLLPIYPSMTAIEIDQRAISFLHEKLPLLNILHCDVLAFDWARLAQDKGGRLSVIANLPYYIVSQVLFSLADAQSQIDLAVVTMQLEVAERICAKPRTKQYGIPSVVFQLYASPQMVFKIPPNVFFPVPKVDSALVALDFAKPHPELNTVYPDQLRK
jgi:16S rRNA (adenine1518-N6/adenine1519-N6)-dimethyltransferase